MAERRAKGIVLVAGLVAAMFAMERTTPPAGAQGQPPVLRSRPADVELDDGYDHVIVHTGDVTPGGAGVVEAEPLGGGDWSLVLERGTDPTAVPGVQAVTADVWLDPYGPTNDPDLGQTWGIDNDGRTISSWPGVDDADIDATTAWHRARGAGAVVAVIDSGVDRTHPDLRDRMWVNADETCGDGDDDDRNGYVDDCNGWDFVRGDATPYDAGVDASHGTHVAGTIAATAGDGFGVAGVAPAARIMGLKVSEGPSFRLSDALGALNYAVANGADVINASWGTTGVPASALLPMEAAVERARQAGVLIAAAAGNDARNIDVSPSFPASFPQENVISVAASTNAEANAYFSNYGSTSVDLHAPGWFVWSTMPGGGHGFMSGTSMAAPHVAGALALAVSANPGASVAEVRAAVLGTVDRVAAYAGRTATGGRLNAASLVGASDLPVAIRFAGTPGAWKVEVRARELPAGDVALLVGLVANRGGEAWAVAGHEVAVGGLPMTTDEGGWLRTPPVPGDALAGAMFPVAVDLPPGEYGLVVGVIDEATGSPIGSPQATFAAIGAPVVEPPAPPPPAVVVPSPTTTTTVVAAPAPTTSTTIAAAPPPSGYQPAPFPPGGQLVPPPTTVPAPCSSCGAPPPAPPAWEPPTTSWPADPDPRPPVGDDAPPWSPPQDEPDAPAPGDVPWSPPVAAEPPPLVTPPWSAPPTPVPTTSTSTTVAPRPTTTTTAPRPTTTTVAPAPPQAPTGTFGLTSVEPSSGRAAGGTTVAIRGTAIPAGATVTIGGTPADVSLVQPPELVLARTRAHLPGRVDVVVTGGGRSQTLAGAFTYLADEPSPTPVPVAPTTTTSSTTSTTAVVEEPAPAPAPVREVAVDGLRLVRLTGDHPVSAVPAGSWPALRCTSEAGCAGTVLRWPATLPSPAPPAAVAVAEDADAAVAPARKAKKPKAKRTDATT